jgi:hypothetical protein
MEQAVSAMVIEESRLWMMSGGNPMKSAYTTVVERALQLWREGTLELQLPSS